jgi:class 3 adenylate cyclase
VDPLQIGRPDKRRCWLDTVLGVDALETRYAKLGEDRIAYQVMGDGPIDLLYAPLTSDCIDLRWDWPPYAEFLRRLATFTRLIMFDRRGFGASDSVSGGAAPTWEHWADDARVVLDAVGSERAVILGHSDAGPIAILFAASQPERTRALILGNTTARFITAPDYPWGMPEAYAQAAEGVIEDVWGTEAFADFGAPDSAHDPAFRRWMAKISRLSSTPRDAATYYRWVQKTDVRDVLSSIRVPTLVVHRERVSYITIDQGRYLAQRIPGARFEVVPGADGTLYTEPHDEVLSHIEDFLAKLPAVEADRALAAVLFTDIVGSTERAVALGDREWRDLLESHDAVSRILISQHRGKLVKMTGDGVLATFDGPGRAIRCAFAVRDALRPLGIEIRAGLHTGEVELRGDDIGGVGVHIAARVLERAGPGELLASSAVPLLVAGSGIAFEDRGEHDLKGVGALRLFAVQG